MSTDLFDRYASLDPANSPQAAPDWASTASVLLVTLDERTTQMPAPDTLDIPTEPMTGRNGMLIAAALFAIVVIAGAVLAIVSTRGEPQPAAPIPEPTHLGVAVHSDDCTIEGPTQFRAGPVSIDLVSEHEHDGSINLIVFDGDETIQDFMDEIGPLPSRADQPYWTIENDVMIDPIAQPGESVRWEGNLDTGTYVLVCSTRVPPLNETTFKWPIAVVSVIGLTVEE